MKTTNNPNSSSEANFELLQKNYLVALEGFLNSVYATRKGSRDYHDYESAKQQIGDAPPGCYEMAIRKIADFFQV